MLPTPAYARRNGIVSQGCTGCHSGGKSPAVTLTLDPAVFEPGAIVTATVSIQALNGSVGGMYLSASTGQFSLLSGQLTSLQSDTEVTHSAPKAATGGNVVFQTRWLAPSNPGGVLFEVWALSANGNNAPSGDGGGSVSLNVPFGCPGTAYYVDLDGDGYAGTDATVFLSCAKQAGFSATRGDCNDNDRNVYPNAPERCNRLDDNCNGQVDEGLDASSITLYADLDGDGYGTAKGATMSSQGCLALPGYAPVAGDCNDHDPAIHPNQPDICNLVDDDCNGQIDDKSRPTCGVGACQARSPSCNPTDCVARPPLAEVCNAADDDCDGLIDNGEALCPLGSTCRSGICVAADSASAGASGGSPSSSLSGTSAGGATSSLQSGSNSESVGCAIVRVAPGSRPRAFPALAMVLASASLLRPRRRANWLELRS
jgi:Putative metal-binding motif